MKNLSTALDSESSRPKIYVYMMGQDDPKKCTSAKLVRHNLALPIYHFGRVPRSSVVLNPFAPEVLTGMDRRRAEMYGLVAVDCSWTKIDGVFQRGFRGFNRRLPLLLAANPTSYGQASRLSSLEALAASLFILGFEEKSKKLLSMFKWGSTFYTLNKAPLHDYQNAKDSQEIYRIESEYFPVERNVYTAE